MDFHRRIENVLNMHCNRSIDLPRHELIKGALNNREAIAAQCGALATWTPVDSTGRSPKDTLIVRRPESEDTIDWEASNNLPLDPDTFEMIKKDALALLSGKERLCVPSGPVSLGAFPLKKGRNILTVEVVGKHTKSPGYYFGLDGILLKKAVRRATL